MAYGNYAPFYRGGYFNMSQNPQMQMQPPQMPDGGYMYQQQNQPMMQMTPQPTNDMIWVLNENEATSYPVAPNGNVVLWDKTNPTIYVKSVNAQGVPSMRILDFSERVAENAVKTSAEHVCECKGKYVTIEAFNALQSDFEALAARLDEIGKKATPKTKKSEAIDDE